ncbi:Imm1 family immunity protein [Kitasatospora sp. NPDC086801]|uniref:Imm1 family immunity protein n=1 Tax=Kitasatospora sp. NPDC086801 TaxID=3364066 RepID=UPI0037F46E5F
MSNGVEVRYKSGHGENPPIITTIDGLDAVVDDLLSGVDSYCTMAEVYSLDRELMPSGFPDHHFIVCADRDLGMGLVSYADEHGNVTSVGSPETRTEPTYHMVGHMTTFADHSEVPIPLVRQALKEFLTSRGQRPECIEWQPGR